jgi:uncharacterized protein with GYD domain
MRGGLTDQTNWFYAKEECALHCALNTDKCRRPTRGVLLCLYSSPYASYSNAGAKGLMDKPADRSEAIKALVEQAGGKFKELYMTTGTNDIVLITEMPDGSDAVALGMAVTASGSVSRTTTVRAWTASEFKGIAEKAAKYSGAYKAPGK